MFICGFYLLFSFSFTLWLPQKIIDGNSFFCQGHTSPVTTLLFPLQNICNTSIHRLMIHGVFPVFICNSRSHCSPAPDFLVVYILHTMISSPVPQPGKPTASLPPLLEHSLLPLSLQNREIKNFPWMWHQKLQIPTLSGSSGAAVCHPDLSREHLQVETIPCSWDEPLAGRTEGDM